MKGFSQEIMICLYLMVAVWSFHIATATGNERNTAELVGANRNGGVWPDPRLTLQRNRLRRSINDERMDEENTFPYPIRNNMFVRTFGDSDRVQPGGDGRTTRPRPTPPYNDKPQILEWDQLQRVRGALGGNATLECQINFVYYRAVLGWPQDGDSQDHIWWTKDGRLINPDTRNFTLLNGLVDSQSAFVYLKLTRLEPSDFGTYTCHASNQFGSTELDSLLYA